MRDYTAEGRRWLEALLPLVPERTAARAWALYGAGLMARHQSDRAAERAHYEAALALSRELGATRLVAWTLRDLGQLLVELGEQAP